MAADGPSRRATAGGTGGKLTLTMSANPTVAHELTHFLEALDAA